MSSDNLPEIYSDEWYALITSQAAEIAAIDVVTWAPIKFGDHAAGRVTDSGVIQLESLRIPGEYDVWPTSTIDPVGKIVMDGKPMDLTGKALRLAWLGPVLVRQYQIMRPVTGDVVAMHYQRDETPKSGLNAYKITNAVVFDGTTGQVKTPIDLTVLANPVTGEISPPGKPNYEPFPDE